MIEPLRLEFAVACPPARAFEVWTAEFSRWWPRSHSVSGDAGATWREAGGGLPPGFAVAIDPGYPDRVLYAARNRLYVSTDGGRFWRGLEPELPDIEAVGWTTEP